MRSSSPLLAVLAGLLAISLIAACGDDDDDDAATEEATEAEGEDEDAGAAGDTLVAVEGSEFAFSFDDGAFTTETTGIVLTNVGEQAHEAFIARIAEDVVVEELLVAGVEDHIEGVELELSRATADPGSEGDLDFGFRLGPGRYLMVCFAEDLDAGPHAFLGMWAEFTVE